MIKLKKSAFVVDDDPGYAHSISVKLENSGYDVKCFSSGHRAINQLRASLDLIVLDYDLGEQQTGLQYLRKIKDTLPEVPVLFLAQMNNAEAASLALWSGASYYIEKSSDFIEKLPKALQHIQISRKSTLQNALTSFRRGVLNFYNF
jgi:DNA-binding NtrC family response regulator